MRRPAKVLVGIILAAGIFLAGYVANRPPVPVVSRVQPGRRPPTVARCIPSTRPTVQAIAPSVACAWNRWLPVVAGGSRSRRVLDNPGMVVVGAARQQLIGVRTDEVRLDSSSHVLRVPGRIAVDDQRLYRIVAAADGWIVDLGQNTVGRFVKKNQFLASYYQKDLLSAERLFLLSIPANEPLQTQTKDFSQASIRTAGSANPQFPIDSLRGLGMSDLQIEEIHRTRIGLAPHQHLLPGLRFRADAEHLAEPAVRQGHGAVPHRRHQPRVGDDRHLREGPAVPEAGRGSHHPVSGPPAQGAHERRAAPVRRAVADAEDPFRARQP